jgi:hypothetical protein
MKKIAQLIFIPIVIFSFSLKAQNQTDSLIRFSDLRFHSDFEKEALTNFVKYGKDTFNLFLAIDEKMTFETANLYRKTFNSAFGELSPKALGAKNLNKKIKISYTAIHNQFLTKYNSNEYFPVMFKSGVYNCVSASMLYAIVFDKLDIPYKVMSSADHVYLVGNPGSNSVVIETTNPNFEKAIFNGDFQQQYVNYLRTSKLISETEYKSKSVQEIFEEKFNEVKSAEFINLPGFQYYNKALTKLQHNEFEEGLKLGQKAYFFYPDNQVKILLNTALLFQIDKCNFDNVSDIDYVAQLSRFENTDLNTVIGIFNNIIYHKLQYTNKETFCDSLYERLIEQLTNKKTIEEISFAYNMQMSYRYQNTEKVEKYITKAMEIKGNFNDANIIMENYLRQKLFNITDPRALLDTVIQLEPKYGIYDMSKSLLTEFELIAYLRLAREQIDQKKLADGDKYLLEFENKCTLPVKSQMLSMLIETTYQSAAFYYRFKRDDPKAKDYVNRGLKYVPNSLIIKSATN